MLIAAKYPILLMKTLLLLTLFSLSITTFAQTDEAVKAPINAFFDGMRNSDSSAIKAVLASGAIFQTITGKNEVKTESISNFISSIAKAAKGSLDEKITFSAINIDGNLASVWTRYEFYYNGAFSHCGVNSFQLHKENGIWKIQYVIDTRRKDGCSNP